MARIAVFAMSALLFSVGASAFQTSDYLPGAAPGTDKQQMADKVEAFIKANLKDADSAKFRNLFFSETPNHTPVLCGEVNAKNGYGGYAGFLQMFVLGIPDNMSLHVDDGSALFSSVWGKACKR